MSRADLQEAMTQLPSAKTPSTVAMMAQLVALFLILDRVLFFVQVIERVIIEIVISNVDINLQKEKINSHIYSCVPAPIPPTVFCHFSFKPVFVLFVLPFSVSCQLPLHWRTKHTNAINAGAMHNFR